MRTQNSKAGRACSGQGFCTLIPPCQVPGCVPQSTRVPSPPEPLITDEAGPKHRPESPQYSPGTALGQRKPQSLLPSPKAICKPKDVASALKSPGPFWRQALLLEAPALPAPGCQSRKLKPVSTHRPICRRLLPDSMQGCWPALWVLRASGDFSGVPVPCHSQSLGALGQGVCAEWCWQPGSLQRTRPKGQAGTITRGHFISRRRRAVFWWQATVRGSDKKHLNPIMD